VIAYLDASALVKRYLIERGSRETIALTARSEMIATNGLRGHDAVQVASALAWQEAVGTEIVLATFDQQLWEAAPEAGVKAWPEKLSG
jgi:predicted nucleic acid-binding protein